MPIDGVYVVFEGIKPGVYRTWDECEAQLNGVPEARYQIFESFRRAESQWLDWQQKVSKMAPRYLHQNSPQPPVQPTSLPPQPAPSLRYPPLQSTSPTSQYASSAEQSSLLITPPCSLPSGSSRKRSSSQMDVFDDGFGTKRQRVDIVRDDSIELARLQRQTNQDVEEEARVELTPEQDKVVKLALRKNNIFLTGAAGSGKTTVLKEIL